MRHEKTLITLRVFGFEVDSALMQVGGNENGVQLVNSESNFSSYGTVANPNGG